jgi:DNA-binding NarL/FixJ family response regulator
MAELILLQVDPGLAREVEQTAARQDAGLNVARADQSREVMDHVEQTPSDVAAVVVGANVSQPTRLAQQIHHIDRQISIVVLTSSAGWQELNQALLFTPLLGQDVQCLATEGHEAVVEAMRGVSDAVARA